MMIAIPRHEYHRRSIEDRQGRHRGMPKKSFVSRKIILGSKD